MPIDVPAAGYRFGLIALEVRGEIEAFVTASHLGGIAFTSKAPFGLTEPWPAWLGEINHDRLARANFCIYVAPSELNERPEAEALETTQRLANYALVGILLQGIPFVVGGLFISGEFETKSKPRATTVGVVESIVRMRSALAAPISIRSMAIAARLAKIIEFVESRVGEYRRLRSGLHAWRRATGEINGGERLHLFMRAVEALLVPERTRIKARLSDRCCALVSDVFREDVGELYELRCAVEHMRLPTLTPSSRHPRLVEGDVLADFRSFQAELLSSVLLFKVLANPLLLSAYRTDEDMRGLWQGRGQDPASLFDAPLDIENMVQDRFGEGEGLSGGSE
jgi:hypothetical protein